jgi:hypothetical protein
MDGRPEFGRAKEELGEPRAVLRSASPFSAVPGLTGRGKMAHRIGSIPEFAGPATVFIPAGSVLSSTESDPGPVMGRTSGVR